MKRFGVHNVGQKVMPRNSALGFATTRILVRQTWVTHKFYIASSAEQLASIDLKTAIYCRGMCKSLRTPIANSVS